MDQMQQNCETKDYWDKGEFSNKKLKNKLNES